MIGGNFRLDGLQAAFLNVKLPHLAEYTARRRQNAAYYLDALTPLCQDCDLRLPAELPEQHHIWNQFTIRVPDQQRDPLRAFLTERGIGTAIYYPVPLHLQECFSGKTEAAALPVAEQLARECLSLPIYPELTRDQIKLVIGTVAEFAMKRLLRNARAPRRHSWRTAAPETTGCRQWRRRYCNRTERVR